MKKFTRVDFFVEKELFCSRESTFYHCKTLREAQDMWAESYNAIALHVEFSGYDESGEYIFHQVCLYHA